MPYKFEDIKINRNKKTITFTEKVNIPESQTKEKVVISNNKPKRLPSTPIIKQDKTFLNQKLFYTFIVLLILSSVYFLGNYFKKANIIIESKKQQITYNEEQFIASHDSGVDFEIMIVPDTKIKKMTLTEPKEVSEYAKGKITLFNEYSTNPQNLSSGTMVSDQDGKVYKITQATTIPGYKLVNGKISAGKVDTPIISFLPGDVYNISSGSFHINAFKGTGKDNKIYGKILEEITGGASGLVYTLDENDIEGIKKFMDSSKNELYDKVQALVPEGYILYEGASRFSYDLPSNFYSNEQDAKIEIHEVLAVIILKEESLIKNIKKNSFPKLSGSELKEIKFSDLDKLTFNFINQDQQINKELTITPFTLSGNILATWYPNIDILKSKLAGLLKKDSISVFKEDPGVVLAIVKIFPFWENYIPSNTNRIHINLK